MVARPRKNPRQPLVRRPLCRLPILVPPLPLPQLTVLPPLLGLQLVTRPPRPLNEVEVAHERSAAPFSTVSEPHPVQLDAHYLLLSPCDASPHPYSTNRSAPLRSLLQKRQRKTDLPRSVDGPARSLRPMRRTLLLPLPLPLLPRQLLLQSPQPLLRDHLPVPS